MDELTELENSSIFKFEQEPKRPYEKDYDVKVDLTIEMNLDQKVLARAGYTFLDYLSDIGGMQGLLISGVAYLVSAWNYN